MSRVEKWQRGLSVGTLDEKAIIPRDFVRDSGLRNKFPKSLLVREHGCSKDQGGLWSKLNET